jgi:predicted NBD/HSP70 family sugar kinase
MLSAIDLGGTKIEVGIFSQDLDLLKSWRVATPRDSYEELLAVLYEQIKQIRVISEGDILPLGMGLPGLVDEENGTSFTSNLPASGKTLRSDLETLSDQSIQIANDCKCFALSEANGGAGEGFETVFGLILGTGVGGGVCRNGMLIKGANGLPGEVGHFALPANLSAELNLPNLTCGCGQSGCYETLCSGPGLSRLCQHYTGKHLSPADIVSSSDAKVQASFNTWAQLIAELLHTLRLTVDPDCIVLGGGLSKIPQVDLKLTQALANHPFKAGSLPLISLPKFGDSSGLRGAALLAARP